MTLGISKNADIPEQLEKDIKLSLENVYGIDKIDVLFANILKIIKKSRLNRPTYLAMDDISRDSSWYKDEIVYTLYANHFGVKDKNTTNTFTVVPIHPSSEYRFYNSIQYFNPA
jgi:hypothetical protein